MKQYLALSRENQAPGVVKPKIRGNVNFEIKSQFMRELREDTFFGNKNEDAHDHVDQVLNIMVPGAVNTWDLLKKAFIQRYCPPSKTAKKLEDIHNFKQESNKSLYLAWEWYTDLLYKCPSHDINNHQKVNIFYKGLSTMNRQLLDSQGPIPGMTLTQALMAIQTMANHSQKWHDGTSSRNISSSCNTNELAAVISKLDNFGRDMKKLKENVHAIQVGCQICEGYHLDKECPLNEEVKQVEEVKYSEFGRPGPFNGSNGTKFHVVPPGYYTRTYNQTPSGEKRPNLVETINKFGEVSEITKDKILRDRWRKRFGNEYDDNENFKDPDECGESKENEILGTIINKLHDEWFKGTYEDDGDLEGIINYLEPTLYDGIIDSDEEEYKERKCRLLGMLYIKPPLILIEKGNIATIRAGIMEEILGNDDKKESYDET
ncbi:putative reverse transcriptase domain-containing protein [Tanacetum coccineum]